MSNDVAIYKHFKGNLYCTMGESTFSPKNASNGDVYYAIHTHFDVVVEIVRTPDGKFHHLFSTEPLVVYKSLYDDSGIYVRPKDDFHRLVDRSKYPNAQQLRRFERLVG